MADNRRVKKSIKQLQRIKTWQLLILLLLMVFVSATFLRLNNIGMIQRREAVIDADKAGDAETTTDRMYDLQRYVVAHMNANTGTFYLESQYKRDSQKVLEAAANDANPNGNVYEKAQKVCVAKYGSLGGYSYAYQECVINQLDSYAPAANLPGTVKLPNPDLYKYAYDSPTWSPDFAGWSVLVCAVIVLMIIARLISLGILRLLVRRHYQSL